MPKAKINKRKILQSLITIPKSSKREVYAKEMKLLNDLISKYSEDFINILKFDKKFDSVAVLLCDSFKDELDKKFRNFNYVVDFSRYEKYSIHENKFGEDIPQILKPKTIREFLNG